MRTLLLLAAFGSRPSVSGISLSPDGANIAFIAPAAGPGADHDRCELVTFGDLDHQLEDSEVRAQMLKKSDAFLREAMGP
jgi:hypothetical protein